jgi:hypothetical protein
MRRVANSSALEFVESEWFLGTFANLRKATQLRHVCLSVCPSSWNNSAPNGRIFMKFDI